MQPFGISTRNRLAAVMRILDERLGAFLVMGLLSSMVLLASSSLPPSMTVSELWGLGDDSSITVSGLLASLWTYESGSEVIVISDESGEPTVKVVCAVGPGPPPSDAVSIGDLLKVSGECVFDDGVPVVYCEYGDVHIVRQSEQVLTLDLLSAAWSLFEGDRISLEGVCEPDASGVLRLRDIDGECSIMMLLDEGVNPLEGHVLADCVLVLDRATMTLVLEVRALSPVD